MTSRPNPLRLVVAPREIMAPASVPERGDLALMAMLLAVNLIPVIGELARLGRFGAGTVGFATACVLVTGRELWLEVRTFARARRMSSP
ncbi:hypothetical protein [Anaeromyxobacter terrae]|uniref:hypothetical protein n=1 Tax=Anaeromyxobacter terrae TaxID=2925406 RepID=UPI001F598614|nr:hypothetical protein [Anaeromyxobacter sp. SG22]